MNGTLIRVEGVSKTYQTASSGNPITALSEVSFEVHDGDFLSIIGPSGCGKTTLLHIIGGLTAPTSGSVYLDDALLDRPQPSKLAWVFQDNTLLPWRSIVSNVAFGLELKGLEKPAREKKAREYLDLVGLNGFEDKYPAELSGGMQQRVAIARALTLEPEILLLDEPFGALDEQTRMLLGDELSRIWKATKKTIILVTHSLIEAAYLSTVVLVMTARPGRIKDTVQVMVNSKRKSTVDQLREELWEKLRDESVKSLGY